MRSWGKFVLSLLAPVLALFANASFAQPTLYPEEELRVMEKHKKEMKHRVGVATDDAFMAYCIKYHVPRSKNRQFYRLVGRREERKAAYDYIYPKAPAKRVRAKMAVDSLYEDSLNAILIPFNKISGENVSYALRIAKVNNVDSTQYEYLLSKALELARKLKKNPRLNVWNEDINTVRQTLTENQLKRFLALEKCRESDGQNAHSVAEVGRGRADSRA